MGEEDRNGWQKNKQGRGVRERGVKMGLSGP